MGLYYEAIYKIETEHANDIREKNREIDELLKYKKALKIIKEKQVNYRTLLCIFNTSDNYHDYNKYYPRNKITQEEYNLLKEMLENE